MTDLDLPDPSNRCALTFFVDTNIVIATVDPARAIPAVDELVKLWFDGWISLCRGDMLDTERVAGQDQATRVARILEAGHWPEAIGPYVEGVSRADTSFPLTAEDDARIRSVHAVTHPGADFDTDHLHHRRDAIHVATALRYGARAFVTYDKNLLKRDGQLPIPIWTAEQARDEDVDAVRRTQKLHELEPARGPLPSWP